MIWDFICFIREDLGNYVGAILFGLIFPRVFQLMTIDLLIVKTKLPTPN